MEYKGLPRPDYESYFKRLVVLNLRGIYFDFADGHTWINCFPDVTEDNLEDWDDAENSVSKSLQKGRVCLNSKIYKGLLSGIDTMDAALQEAGELPLINQFQEWMVLGDGGVDLSRIDTNTDGGLG